MTARSVLGFTAAVALVGAVALAGVFLGSSARRWWSAPAGEDSLLVPGRAFPDVELSAADGTAARSGQLAAERGAVVLFLDLDCGSCSEMAAHWEPLSRELPVLGVAAASAEAIRRYKDAHGLTFPIYADPGGTFQRDWRVTSFPLRLLVARSGTIVAAGHDAAEPVDPAALRAQLAR
ncbi:MAG TPA: TlpA disulfide reductase family protein [Candidatus Polarisedimenticolaceae bacterium]|nr:TlpA disulfide reductase family protein [Candidatus Polarisedimenticolaceae bacterium]